MLKTIHDPKPEECKFYDPLSELAKKPGYITCELCKYGAEINKEHGKVIKVGCECPEMRRTIKKEEIKPMRKGKEENKAVAKRNNKKAGKKNVKPNNKKTALTRSRKPAKTKGRKTNNGKRKATACNSRTPEYRAERRRLIKVGKWKVGKGGRVVKKAKKK